MKKEFVYRTSSESKRVVMGKMSKGWFVDIYPEFGMFKSDFYNTEEEANKRFFSIKRRVRVISE